MKVAGFTFIKDAIIYDYPIVEAIRSILPLCDEFVVAVGKSNDETRQLIEQIDSDKIRIIDTIWDETLREGGAVLAAETNKAKAQISADVDWAFYIQGDEVFPEEYLASAKEALEQHLNNPSIDGLLFNYLHFYGSYDFVGDNLKWYKHEIRIIRNDSSIYSYKDAQGFRKGNNEKLTVAPANAYMHHYGWVKPPDVMQQKQINFNRYWHNDQWIDKNVGKKKQFDYLEKGIKLRSFAGKHPAVMQTRVENVQWEFNYDSSKVQLNLKEKIKEFLFHFLGIDFSYKNYMLKK